MKYVTGFMSAMLFGMFAYGWVSNIIELFTAPVLSGMEVARAIGVLAAPLGAILGYF